MSEELEKSINDLKNKDTPLFEAEILVKQAIERHKPNIYVAFSGGKCSEVVLHMALKYWPEIPVMFNNTGVEFPETIEFVHMLKEKWNLNLIETHPKKTFWQCADEYGFPGIKRQSKKESSAKTPKCCLYLKEKPALDALREHGFIACFTGIRGEESWNRRNLIRFCGQRYFAKSWGIYKYHPIAFWTGKEVREYIQKNDLPLNPAYVKWEGLYDRVGCLPCTSYKNWEHKLSISHPALYNMIQKKRMEQSFKSKEKYNKIVEMGVPASDAQGLINNVGIIIDRKICCKQDLNDSIALMVWAKNNIKNAKIEVVFINSPMEFKDLKDYLKYVAEELKIKLIVRDTKKDMLKKFEEKAKKVGVPLFVTYCENELKKPSQKDNDKYELILSGDRWFDKSKLCFWKMDDEQITFNPLLDWSNEDIYHYIEDNKIKLYWAYKYLTKLSCALCPNKILEDKIPLELLLAKKFPKKYNWKFYNSWFENIANSKDAKRGKTVTEKNNKFVKKLDEFKKMKNIKLDERKVKAYGWWNGS